MLKDEIVHIPLVLQCPTIQGLYTIHLWPRVLIHCHIQVYWHNQIMQLEYIFEYTYHILCFIINLAFIHLKCNISYSPFRELSFHIWWQKTSLSYCCITNYYTFDTTSSFEFCTIYFRWHIVKYYCLDSKDKKINLHFSMRFLK